MTDTTVKIKSKAGCSDTGITDTLATRLYNKGTGHRFVAIVEFKVDELGEVDAGNDKVFLTVEAIEPVIAKDGNVDRQIDEHVRTIQKALFRNRKLASDGEQLPFGEEDGPTPRHEDLIAAGMALLPDDDPDQDEAAEEAPDEQDEPTDADTPEATDPDVDPDTDDPAEPDESSNVVGLPAFSG